MNASKRYLAMASSLGMHQGTISPSRCRGGATRCMLPAGPKLGRRAERGGGTELRGSWRSFGTERAASAGRSCGAEGRSGGRPNCGAPGRCGAAVSAGGWASPREGHGHLRMTNYPRQRKGSQLTPPSPPRQRKASALLAFLCCFVYGSSGPRAFAVTSRQPSGSSSVGDSAFGRIALHVRFANRQSTREDPRAHWRKPHHKQTVSLQQSPRLRPWGTLQHSRRKRCRPLRLQPCIRRLQPRCIPGGKRRCKCRSQCTHRQ